MTTPTQNRKFIQLIFIVLSFSAFFFSTVQVAEAVDCYRPYCDGSSCGGGWQGDGGAIGCAAAGEVVCQTDSGPLSCGVWEEFVYPPVYSSEPPPPPCVPEPGSCNAPSPSCPDNTSTSGTDSCGNPCGYSISCACGGEGQACCGSAPYCTAPGTVCCQPGSNLCLLQCSGGYGSEYPNPYGSEYGSEYPTPPYGYPTPSEYAYQSEYPSPPPPGVFDYSLSNSGDVNVTKSGVNVFANKDINKTLVSGTAEPVTISLSFPSGLPDGVSYSLAQGNCSPSCTTTITFTISPAGEVGTHPVVVTGSPLSKTTQFNLIISAASAGTIGVICTPSDEEIVLGEIITWTGEIDGGTPPYTYSWNGPGIPTNPAPSTNPMTIRYSTVGVKTAMLTVTDSEDEQGFCIFDGEGSSESLELKVNFNPAFEEF